MLTDVLINTFGILMEDVTNFTDGKQSTPVYFKYICKSYTNDGNDDKIFNEDSYVYLDDPQYISDLPTLMSKVIVFTLNDMYINRLPKTTKNPISRFITKISIKVTSISTVVAFLTDKIKEQNISNTIHAKKYLMAIQRTLLELDKYTLTNFLPKSDKKDCRLYIDIYDSVINSSTAGIINNETNIPIFTTNSVITTLEKKDYQINFGDKGDGIISSSLNINPFMLRSGKACITYDTIDSSCMTIANEKITIDYIGSITDKALLYDYNKFRSSLKLTFIPNNGKIFTNKHEFDEFNKLIDYLSAGSYGQVDSRLMEILLNLETVEISCKDNIQNNPYGEDVSVFNIFENFMLSSFNVSDTGNILYDKMENSITWYNEKQTAPLFKLGALFYYGK